MARDHAPWRPQDRPVRAGNKLAIQPSLAEAVFLAANRSGDRLAAQAAREADENIDDASLDRWVEEHGGVRGYLDWLSTANPSAFARNLARIPRSEVKIGESRAIEYRSVDEINNELRKRGLASVIPLLEEKLKPTS